MAEMVYLQLAESVLAEKRKVLIRDVSKVVYTPRHWSTIPRNQV